MVHHVVCVFNDHITELSVGPFEQYGSAMAHFTAAQRTAVKYKHASTESVSQNYVSVIMFRYLRWIDDVLQVCTKRGTHSGAKLVMYL